MKTSALSLYCLALSMVGVMACKADQPSSTEPAPRVEAAPQAPSTPTPPASEPAAKDEACATLLSAFVKENDTTYYTIHEPCIPEGLDAGQIRETYYKPLQLKVEAKTGKNWRQVVAMPSRYKSRAELDAHVQQLKGKSEAIPPDK